MAQTILKNGALKAVIDAHGAELKSLMKGDTEYMWCADPAFWGRTSPVLFPFVGAVRNGLYRVDGTEYKMGQHGFARDMDFTLVESTESTCLYSLKSNEETYAKYPYEFELLIGYELTEAGIKVLWTVKNPGDKTLEFSIGAHPAFGCILSDTSICFKKDGEAVKGFTNSVFGKGLLTNDKCEITLDNGIMKLDEHSFDGDAYVIENDQVDEIQILDKDGNFHMAVAFTSPLVGVWSPPAKNAPFLCIEPWYGRADKEDFDGDIRDREWNNSLKSGDCFSVDYSILV